MSQRQHSATLLGLALDGFRKKRHNASGDGEKYQIVLEFFTVGMVAIRFFQVQSRVASSANGYSLLYEKIGDPKTTDFNKIQKLTHLT